MDPLKIDETQNFEVSKKEQIKNTKFGDCLCVTLHVENGNLGDLEATKQNQIGGIAGLMANIDQELENELEYSFDHSNESPFYENLKVEELDFDQIISDS